jgi:hypothetical protein
MRGNQSQNESTLNRAFLDLLPSLDASYDRRSYADGLRTSVFPAALVIRCSDRLLSFFAPSGIFGLIRGKHRR